jgi:hypothetical protein
VFLGLIVLTIAGSDALTGDDLLGHFCRALLPVYGSNPIVHSVTVCLEGVVCAAVMAAYCYGFMQSFRERRRFKQRSPEEKEALFQWHKAEFEQTSLTTAGSSPTSTPAATLLLSSPSRADKA